MVQFALFAAIGLAKQAQAADVNVWYCPYIDILDVTPLDDSGGAHYDPRDMFGGTFGNMPHEQGHVVFEDNNGGPGHPDFVEWNTKNPVVINRLVFSWQDDAPGANWRNLAHFWIYGRRTASEPWKILWQENTPSHVGRYTMEKKIAADQYQMFRAEFLRSSADNKTAEAPRICEIEAYGHEVRTQGKP
jgi:hypothetical protein